MGRAAQKIANDIGCIDTAGLRATLVSDAGFHCDVWQASRIIAEAEGRRTINCVIKHHRLPCSAAEVRILRRDYRELKRRLGGIVPNALFVRTRVDGAHNVVAIAKAITPWFNIANPLFEEDALPLLRRLTRARAQLAVFVAAARHWYDTQHRVIDLWGVDNLVLDNQQRVRYLDSFNVFFYPDVAHVIAGADDLPTEAVAMSLKRLEYLEYLLREAEGG